MFWDNVQVKLTASHTTQIELAKAIDVPLSTLRQQVHFGRVPDAETAVKIAKVLNTTVEELVTGYVPAQGENRDAIIENYLLEELEKIRQKKA